MSYATNRRSVDLHQRAVRWLVGAVVLAASGLALLFFAILVAPALQVEEWILASLALADLCLWIVGASLYARSLGRSGLLGALGLLGPVGLFVLWLVPDRRRDEAVLQATSHLTNYPR